MSSLQFFCRSINISMKWYSLEKDYIVLDDKDIERKYSMYVA